MANIVVLGAGMMGSALAWPLVDRGHGVRLVGTHLDEAIVASVRATRRHPTLGLDLPESVQAFPLAELARALDGADAVALGVSSAGVRWAGRTLAPYARPELPLAMVSKGLEWDGTDLRALPDVLLDELPPALRDAIAPVGVAGPCIAGELARRVPTTVVLTARRAPAIERWIALLRGPYYHLFPSQDVLGVELCAALKNAYAMGIALAAGIHEGRGGTSGGSIALHNYEAAVFAQSIWEMQRLIALSGGDPASAAWLPGVGDLDVTCNGGRTGRFGKLLGRGLSPTDAVEAMQGATLECLEILRVLREALAGFAAQGRLTAGELPLAETLAAIALDGAPVDMPFERFFGAGKR